MIIIIIIILILAQNKKTTEAATLDRVLDRDWTHNRRGPLSRSACSLMWSGYRIENPEIQKIGKNWGNIGKK